MINVPKLLKIHAAPDEGEITAPVLPPDAEARRQLLERIAASSKFRRADRLRHLLLFLENAREHQNVSELEIATEVFHRGRDYASSEDSIVRVTMRQLRFKLKEYFESEGVDEPWVIHIPKGEYALVYTRRVDKPAAAADVAHQPRSAIWLCLLATALLFSLGLNVWFSARPTAGAEPTLLSTFCSPSGQLTVVASDGALPLLRRLLDTRIDEVRHDPKLIAQQLRAHGEAGVPPHLASWYLNDPAVPFAHANAAAFVLRSRHARGEPVVMRHAPGLQVRDFHEGNLAVIGSEWTNVWAGLFEKRLNFRFEVPDKPGAGASFINTRPAAGEPAVYKGEKPAHNWGKTYSRLAVVPNLSGSGTVFLLAGLDMFGTEAAAEFLTSTGSYRAYKAFIEHNRISEKPYFEVLLVTAALDGVPTKTDMVAWRQIRARE